MVSPLSIGFSTMERTSCAYSAGRPSREGCGRIVVLRHGRSVATFEAGADEAAILDAATATEAQAA